MQDSGLLPPSPPQTKKRKEAPIPREAMEIFMAKFGDLVEVPPTNIHVDLPGSLVHIEKASLKAGRFEPLEGRWLLVGRWWIGQVGGLKTGAFGAFGPFGPFGAFGAFARLFEWRRERGSEPLHSACCGNKWERSPLTFNPPIKAQIRREANSGQGWMDNFWSGPKIRTKTRF